MCDSDSGLSISMNGSNKDVHQGSPGSTVIKISVPSVNVEVRVLTFSGIHLFVESV